MKKRTRNLCCAAVIAALYVVLSFMQNLLFPGSTSMAVQFRVAEALCIFALFTPAAAVGLGLGCLLYNLIFPYSLPMDFLIGTTATLLAAWSMYATRKVKLWRLPLLALLMPAVFNGLIVGGELTLVIGESPFWFNALCVAAGEAAVLYILGIPLYLAFTHKGLDRRLFPR